MAIKTKKQRKPLVPKASSKRMAERWAYLRSTLGRERSARAALTHDEQTSNLREVAYHWKLTQEHTAKELERALDVVRGAAKEAAAPAPSGPTKAEKRLCVAVLAIIKGVMEGGE